MLRGEIVELRGLIEAVDRAEVAKQVDLLRKRMKRTTDKGFGPDGNWLASADPDKTLAALAGLAKQVIELAEPVVVELKQVSMKAGQHDTKRKSLAREVEQADKNIGRLKALNADPRAYAKSATVSYGMDLEGNAIAHYEQVTKELWQALRTASSYARLV
jgi:hypothetical protein